MAEPCSYCSPPPDFDEASYDLALRLLSGARATATQLNEQLEGIKADIRRAAEHQEEAEDRANEREVRVRALELQLVQAQKRSPALFKALELSIECPVCEGDGYIDDGSCGDPECCGGSPSCDYCDGDGTLRGRFTS